MGSMTGCFATASDLRRSARYSGTYDTCQAQVGTQVLALLEVLILAVPTQMSLGSVPEYLPR